MEAEAEFVDRDLSINFSQFFTNATVFQIRAFYELVAAINRMNLYFGSVTKVELLEK